MLITDLDINSIEIATFRPQAMYSVAAQAEERSWLLLKRH